MNLTLRRRAVLALAVTAGAVGAASGTATLAQAQYKDDVKKWCEAPQQGGTYRETENTFSCERKNKKRKTVFCSWLKQENGNVVRGSGQCDVS